MANIIVLNDQDVEKLISFSENLDMIERAFGDYNSGKSHVFPVVREAVTPHQGIFGIKSGYLETQNILGFKAGGFWANNKNKGLANHQSVIVLFNPETGQPCALVAANFVTQIRTAAIGAIGCKYLARPDCHVLAIIGAGQQGRNQLKAALHVLPAIKEIYLYDVYTPAAEALAQDMSQHPGKITVTSAAEEACSNADVIVTATSSYTAIVMADWVKKGAHINAVGTDTKGKQELDPQIFAKASVVVDNMEQCLQLGESQHAYAKGIITRESIYAEIGEIINGTKQGRATREQITLFDTTGVAIQDLATAGYAFEQAAKRGMGIRIAI
jgi:alanine dehydrogenase